MDSEYGARYRDLYQRHWWWRARERVILDALRARRPAAGWGNVLDIGCGDGLFFDELAKLPGVRLVEGVEPAEALVTRDGPHRARIHVVPFDAGFDVGRRYSLITMLDVVEHLVDPVASLRHAVSLLEPGGVLLTTVPAFRALWTGHDDLNHHYTRYDKQSFGALAVEAGYRVDAMRYLFQWTAVSKIAIRVKEAVFPGEPVPPSVPWGPLNSALYALSTLEERAFRKVALPFGSSLLVVGGARSSRGIASVRGVPITPS